MGLDCLGCPAGWACVHGRREILVFIIIYNLYDISHSKLLFGGVRFDPFGPPGGPTDPGRGRGRFSGRGVGRGGVGRGGRGGGRMPPPPGGFGDPNPDHLKPPGGGYFS